MARAELGLVAERVRDDDAGAHSRKSFDSHPDRRGADEHRESLGDDKMVMTNMVKKLFALASVSALTGLAAATGAAGCTSETSEATPVQDAGTTDAKKTPTLASDDGGEQLCYDTDPYDATTIPYKKARALPGSCSANIRTVLGTLFFENPQMTPDELKERLASQESQACADCAVAPDDGDSWAPIVWDGIHLIQNLGGCLEVLSGKEECGRAYTQWNGCLNVVCGKCTTQNEALECLQNVQTTACSDATKALITACGDDVNSYIDACAPAGKPSAYEAIIKLCGGGPDLDAGSDSGSE